MVPRKNRICILCEFINPPFDEGMKKTVSSLSEAVGKKRKVAIIGRAISPLLGHSHSTNRFFLSRPMIFDIKNFRPDVILYFPEASLTIGAFIRGKIVSINVGRPIVIVGLQNRRYNFLSKFTLTLLKPALVLCQSTMMEDFYCQMGMKTGLLKCGIDLTRFRPVTSEKKGILKQKYGLPLDKKVILHIGHLNENRRVMDLIEIGKGFGHILVVGSTSTVQDEDLKNELKTQGVTVIDSYVKSIEEIYQSADLYVFPTRSQTGAMEFPLSILEAMGCGLPILTTRFGSLMDYFEGDNHFRYYENLTEARSAAQNILNSAENNNKYANVIKVGAFSWEKVTDELLYILDKL